VQAAIALPFVGALTEQVLKSSYGFDIPWWVFVVVGTLFTAVSSWFGIKISARVLVILSLAELVILIALGGWGIFSPGPGGFNFKSFNPGSAPSFSAIGLGVLYTVTAYAGWVAEENLGVLDACLARDDWHCLGLGDMGPPPRLGYRSGVDTRDLDADPPN